jgi:hypothetical protein
MEDFDLNNLSPEDRALFDAMVQEEMMKLEVEFQKEVESENIYVPPRKPPPQSQHDYQQDYRSPPPVRVPPKPAHGYGGGHSPGMNYPGRDYEREEPQRNNYHSKNNKDVEIDIQVKGPPPKGFGNHEISREEKRAKQMEYARQLSDQAELPQPSSQRLNQPRNSSRVMQDEEQGQGGLQFGRDDTQNAKRSKQQEYARLLQMDQQASQPSERSSLSANSRSKSNPRVGYESGRQELSSSRSDSNPRGAPAARSPGDERRAKIEKQREYAHQLQLQQQQQEVNKQQQGYDPSGISSRSPYHKLQQQQSPHKSPSSSYHSKASLGPNSSERDLKHQKQQEYAEQLAADQRNKESARNNSSGQRSDRHRLTPRDERDSQIPYSTSPSHPTPSGRRSGGGGDGGAASEKELKLRKQQEYARQLEMDQLSKQSARDKESNRISHQQMNSPLYSPPSSTSLASQVSQSHIVGAMGGEYDPRQEKLQKRREQEKYAQQIREAASQQEILSPRLSLNDKRRSPHSQRGYPSSSDNATGLVLPGANIATAVQKDAKKLQQEKYRQDLEADMRTNHSSRSLEPTRAPLHRRREDLSSGGGGGGGLIGHHESEDEKRRKKKELQSKYSHELAMQQQQSGRGGGGGGWEGAEEEPYDPRGLVHRDTPPREIRDVSPIVYPPSQRQYPQNSDYQHDPYSAGGSQSLQQLREQASRHVEPGYGANHDPEGSYYSPQDPYQPPPRQRQQQRQTYEDEEENRGYPSSTSAGSGYGSASRQQAPAPAPARSEPEPEPYLSPRQQQQVPRYHPSSSECTGLVIGGMTVLTAEQKNEKHRQQQQYAREVADAVKAQPVHVSRESYQERHRYKGNGLPGEHLSGGGAGGGAYDRNPPLQRGGGGAGGGGDGEYRVRGTSNGGGASSISFGGGGSGSPGQQRMQRRGKQEEYASQLRQQMNYNVSLFPFLTSFSSHFSPVTECE